MGRHGINIQTISYLKKTARAISTSTQIENNEFYNGGVTRFQPSALCLYTLTPPSGDGWLLTTKFNILENQQIILLLSFVALVHMFTFVTNDYNNIICPFSQCKSFNLGVNLDRMSLINHNCGGKYDIGGQFPKIPIYIYYINSMTLNK
ncbi:hypothetical protein ACTFIW_006778 [Dictyostelium discoideum]